MAIHISDKIDSKSKTVTKDKKRSIHNDTRLVQLEDEQLKCTKQQSTQLYTVTLMDMKEK